MTAFFHKTENSEVSGDFSKLEKLIENLGKKHFVDIGILGEGGKTEKGGITLAGIGAVQEFGTNKAGRGRKTTISERSFIRTPLETGQEDIEKAVEPRLEKLLEDGDIEGIFKLIGIAGEARIQEAFETEGFGEWAPNSDITIHGSNYPLIQKGKQLTQKQIANEFIKGKDSAVPLINTGALRQSITSKVGGS
jgi:hypothetical protein